MCNSPREALDQVERECDRAHGHTSAAENVLGIAVYELRKAIRKYDGHSELAPVHKRLEQAVTAARALHAAITAVENAVKEAC